MWLFVTWNWICRVDAASSINAIGRSCFFGSIVLSVILCSAKENASLFHAHDIPVECMYNYEKSVLNISTSELSNYKLTCSMLLSTDMPLFVWCAISLLDSLIMCCIQDHALFLMDCHRQGTLRRSVRIVLIPALEACRHAFLLDEVNKPRN